MDDHRGAGPQLEDGHVRIANELYDAILSKLASYRHIKIVLAIIRKTYGYSKKEDDITISQLADITGIHRNNVGKALKEIEAMRVINTVRAGRHGLILGINKHHEQWSQDEVKPRGHGREAIKLIDDESSNQIDCAEQSKRLIQAIKTIDSSNQNVAHNNQPQQPTPTTNPNRFPEAQQMALSGELMPATLSADATAPAPTATRRPKAPADASALDATRAVWSAYSDSYRSRYGEAPVRPVRVNAQIKRIVETVGREEAPQLAAWFVSHPAQWYVAKGHDIGLLLADIMKLRTEWATGRVTTTTAARQSDRRGAMASAVSSLLAECGGDA